MEQKRLIFPKSERLTGEVRIKEHYEKGSFFLNYPFRVGYSIVPKSETPIKILISVPKKRFKHAVDRNRIKRLIREVYRKNKAESYAFVAEKDYAVYLSISYVSSEHLSYDFIEKKWISTAKKLIDVLP